MKKKTKPGWIYVIGYGEYWKVGMTKRLPEERLRDMQTGNPFNLIIIAKWLVEHINVAEKIAHAKLNKLHYRSEWYKGPPDEVIGMLLQGGQG